ncbi:hypothetical protein GKC30_06120 [Pseudodesulfovibrio sp. F-1]|uniref:Uncharacterized protein n=1 Tax=Pseudodesulfovibrio alkaliphilus TaxID=2661613 RepID=A0A7K1KMA7_9BACT|nr:hypothetical protein [Pseudodesulfovibrio alkaliphilus]MUM77205.1 hypothetical protein [Pseudodesulfovibrio alkaliphilus]
MAEYHWNGVGLTVPDEWEPLVLERDGLTLGSGSRPMCELKWRTVAGGFSFEKHLRRLAKGHRDAAVRAVADDDPPLVWREAVEGLERSGLRVRSFVWQAGGHRGMGAALHGPGTGLAALVQFFMHGEEDREAEGLAAAALAAFRDHTVPWAERSDPASRRTVPFCMFGLRGRVPASFGLDSFSFRPGHYRVRYWRPRRPDSGNGRPTPRGSGTRLTFERFAPASVLLKGRGLDGWAAEALADPPPVGAVSIGRDGEAVWSCVAATSVARRLLRRENHARGRVWLPAGTNHILAVTATGAVPMPDAPFAAAVQSYELV